MKPCGISKRQLSFSKLQKAPSTAPEEQKGVFERPRRVRGAARQGRVAVEREEFAELGAKLLLVQSLTMCFRSTFAFFFLKIFFFRVPRLFCAPDGVLDAAPLVVVGIVGSRKGGVENLLERVLERELRPLGLVRTAPVPQQLDLEISSVCLIWTW